MSGLHTAESVLHTLKNKIGLEAGNRLVVDTKILFQMVEIVSDEGGTCSITIIPQGYFRSTEFDQEKTAFEKIEAGLKDAIACTQGDESRGRVAIPLAIVDKIGRTSGIVVSTVIAKSVKALNVDESDLSVIRPTVVTSAYGKDDGESVSLAMLFTMARLKNRKLHLVFKGDGEDDIVVPVE